MSTGRSLVGNGTEYLTSAPRRSQLRFRSPVRAGHRQLCRDECIRRPPCSDFRDQPLHRQYIDDMSQRSPSPHYDVRGGEIYRSRYSDKHGRRRRLRSSSPHYSSYYSTREHRPHSQRLRHHGANEEEDHLPVPQRAQQDVPEVQILTLDEVDRDFILCVEMVFRNHGLRVGTLILGPLVPLCAAINRQLDEGVPAIVRLSRSNQLSRKIHLQIFDRTAEPANKYSDYPEVDISVAAGLILQQIRAMQRNFQSAPFASVSSIRAPQKRSVHNLSLKQHYALHAPSDLLNTPGVVTSLNASSLQSVISALQQQAIT